jgi:hypothetical protein
MSREVNGVPAPAGAPGGGNARATMTFAVVYAFCPLGNPAGMLKPLGLKKAWWKSTPLSMIPILIPCPAVARPGPQRFGAPICCGLLSSAGPYCADG